MSVTRRQNPGSDGWKSSTSMKWTPNGEISTVGLFYSQGEAEKIVARLQSIPEKADRRGGHAFRYCDQFQPLINPGARGSFCIPILSALDLTRPVSDIEEHRSKVSTQLATFASA